MEYWSEGVLARRWHYSNTPILHHSITPTPHYSNTPSPHSLQVAHVAPGFEKPLAVVPKEDVPACIASPEAARGAERNSQRVPKQRADGAAMRDDDNGFSGVTAGEFIETGVAPLRGLPSALALRDDIIGTTGFEEAILLRKLLFEIRLEEILKDAEVSLAQTCIGTDFVAGDFRDTLCSFERAAKVAAVKRGELRTGEPSRQRLRLRDTHGREGTVELALVSAFDVPGRFAVAKEDDPGDAHAPWM